MNPERIGLLVLLVVCAATVFFVSTPQRSTGDDTNVPTTTKLRVFAPEQPANGTLTLEATKPLAPGTRFVFNVADNIVSEPNAQVGPRSALGFTASYERNRALFDTSGGFPFGDFGAFAAGVRDSDGHALTAGLRTSPIRLLYGTIAPDVLISESRIGLGVSGYAPTDLVGRQFRHWGVGFGHFWATDRNGRDGNAVYVSFTTKVP